MSYQTNTPISSFIRWAERRIAQEIELVLPHAVIENEHGLKQVNTDPIFWSMVKAIQELSTQNAALAARLTTLEEG